MKALGRGRRLLFGGSFNPIHNGHLAAARFCRDALGFERVIFAPNGDAYPKPGLAPARLRLEIVRAALRGEPQCEVYDAEARDTAPLRVVQTARALRQGDPQRPITLFRGLDALPKTHRAHFEIPDLRVLVVDRAGSGLDFEAILRAKPHLAAHRARIDYLPAAFEDPRSSTALRAGEISWLEGVPEAALKLIYAYGLYGAGR
ncbi:nicotinate-nicotinamide nucleotide adenylyltransferase [Myxococcota bacterium]|nr:nicotinate-nicotinamide nucleotide adenylyltransferase [Myxococcota bacterium]MBU1432301.1 nicotinate-nicotinamide nucleotide adenylyltransferase [Myxococcota bacterium]MBU1899270.1 nicotinate-nicotinamide nucleotide adenylyltransferase [Myxococcota bacterium]